MKTKMKFGALLAISSVLSFGKISAQVTDTVQRETVVVQPVVRDENPPLRVLELGARYMPTFTSLGLTNANGEVVRGDVTMSHGVGGVLGINFSRHVGIQGEVIYNQVMQKYRDQSLDRQINVNYLNIPVMLSLNTNKRLPVNLNVVAGPQFSINVGSTIKTNGGRGQDNVQATVAAKPGDVGLAYGAGLEFALNRSHNIRLDFGYRGMYGLFDLGATKASSDTYIITAKGSRRSHAGYAGLTFCF
ncbi:MAG: porin family protein [Bacteroidia bacterium]